MESRNTWFETNHATGMPSRVLLGNDDDEVDGDDDAGDLDTGVQEDELNEDDMDTDQVADRALRMRAMMCASEMSEWIAGENWK